MGKHDEDLRLLKAFAPILKFSLGERFFPMNVRDFISEAKLHNSKDKNYKIKGAFLLEGQLEEDSREYYLQYIPSKSFFEKINLRDLLLMILAIITIIVGIQSENIPAFADDLKLTQGDYIKIGFLFVIALMSVILQGRRKIYFSFAFFFTALFFYGHIVGVGLGYLSVLGLVFLGTVRWYSIRKSTQRLAKNNTDEYVAFGLGLVATLSIGYLTFRFGFPLLGFNPNLLISFPGLNLEIPQWLPLLIMIIIGPIIAVAFWKWWEGIAVTVSAIYLIFIYSFHNSWINIDSNLKSIISALVSITCLLMALKLLQLFDQEQPQKLQESLRTLMQSPESNNLSNRALVLMLVGIAFWWGGTFLSYYLFSNVQWGQSVAIIIFPLVLIFLIAMLILILVGIVLVGGDLIRWYMDLRSSAPDTVAKEAEKKYKKVQKKNDDSKQYTFYGRVVTDGTWTSLEYHFFYAFNDWRSNADGLNHHEGDWEAAAVFLETIDPNATDIVKRYKPFGVACSQHEEGEFRFLDQNLIDEKYKIEVDDSHPIIYPAKGSHANYFKAKKYSTAFQFTGLMRRIVGYLDEVMQDYGNNLGLEIALGGGYQVDVTNANIELVNDNLPTWIKYQGLWGRKTSVKEESGPRGPKWDISEKDNGNAKNGKGQVRVRPRWKLHEWKDRLLFKIFQDSDVDTELRLRALKHLTNR